jgi:DNA-binding CsgD family transcriptional regulator
LEALAAEAGVLVLVDDVQWLDAASLDALCFAARRLGRERVAVVLAARAEPDRELTARGLEVVELAGLAPGAARRLVGADVAPEPMRVVLEHARGNPLALVELGRALTPEERAGAVALSAPMPPAGAIEARFRAELDALPATTVRALLVPAADERLTLARQQAVLARLGLPATALSAAEAAGVLRAEDGLLRFRHPLLRSVAYHAARPADRATVHAALAEEGGDAIRRAWHLAAAATGPDEPAAAALTAAGEAARGRGAVAEAAEAFARAAELTQPGAVDARAARALAAARLLALSGQPERALALADAASDPPPGDSALHTALAHVRGAVVMRTGALDAGAQILVDAAGAADDPARAALMLLDANLRNRVIGDYPAMVRLARRTRALAATVDPPLAALGELSEAVARVNTGDGVAGDATIARHEAVLLDPATARVGLEVLGSPAHASIWTERFGRADRILSTLIVRARRDAAVTALVYPLAARAQLALRRGRLRAAYADGDEAVRIALETRQHGLLAFALAMLSEVEAALGREAECREHAAATIGICDAIGGHAMGMWGRNALGLLELGLGRPEAAVTPLAACADAADRIGMREPNTVQWAANYVEALARSGDEEAARANLARLEAGCGTAWAAAALLRCRGLLAPGDAGDALLEEAADAFARAGAQFEAARTRLALGARRRVHRPSRAREPLTAALGVFEAGGAVPWAERARAELRSSGDATGPARPAGTADLTPHELRVALMVAEGRTNPEVAAQLFVTRKTVEHHLSQVYRKLGLRSRTQLARALAAELAP